MTKVQAEMDKRYANDFMLVASLVWYWRKQKPDNDELKALSLSIADIGKYVNGLQNEVQTLRKLTDDKV